MEVLFYLGILLLPFENFAFAPSSGWAALSPLVFAAYVVCNYRILGKSIMRYKKLLLIIAWVIFISLVNLLFIGQYQKEAFYRFLSALISLGLVIMNLLCFDIYFIVKKKSVQKVEKLLFLTYMISLMVGLVQYLTIRLNVDFIRVWDALISKRSYLRYNRVQFTFTEPSFIGMHLFGVLLPMYIYHKNARLKNLIILYGLCSIFFGSGVRILVDTVVVAGIVLFYKLNFRKARNVTLIMLSILAISLGGTYVYNNNYRVRQIVTKGVYADGSFASRYFRINASMKGYQNNFLQVLLGYGLGQEILPLKLGYDEAVSEYQSSYTKEVSELRDAEKTREESASYCLFIRIISECGMAVFFILCIWIGKRITREKGKEGKALILITAYLYIQFESYAFYAVWLVIVLLQLRIRGKQENAGFRISASEMVDGEEKQCQERVCRWCRS